VPLHPIKHRTDHYFEQENYLYQALRGSRLGSSGGIFPQRP
jgi:hypothetical protein